MNTELHTPVIKQYLEIKARHKNSFVFFRMGDFYELFFEDAVKASEILNLTLTKRGKVEVNMFCLPGFLCIRQTDT